MTRISEIRNASLEDRLAATLYLLSRISLSPLDIVRVEVLLARGTVLMQYFGFCDPVGLFTVSVGSQQHKALTAAVVANKEGPLFWAAIRSLAYRERKKLHARQRREDVLMGQARTGLTWPTREEAFRDPHSAKSRTAANYNFLAERLSAIRDLRGKRLAKVASFSAPGITCWTGLLQDIDKHVFGAVFA